MHFEDTLSLREARRRYFSRTGFNEAQYTDRFVKLDLYGLPVWFPNTKSRQGAVRYHDLHHILTGYDTTWRGEAQISAWELATGCRRFRAAWVINMLGLLMGLAIAPMLALRAYRRGMASSNLYSLEITDPLLDENLGALRDRLGLRAADADSSHRPPP